MRVVQACLVVTEESTGIEVRVGLVLLVENAEVVRALRDGSTEIAHLRQLQEVHGSTEIVHLRQLQTVHEQRQQIKRRVSTKKRTSERKSKWCLSFTIVFHV